MLKAVLAVLFCCLLGTSALAEDPALAKVAETIQAADKYSYTLKTDKDKITVNALSGEDFGQVQESEGNGIRAGANNTWEASPHIAHRIIPFIITRAFRIRPAPMVMTMDIGGLAAPLRLYALGDAEATYAILHLAPQDVFNKWLAKHASPGSDIADLPKDGLLQKTTKEASDTNGLLAAAKRRYNHVRAQLIRRFNASYLYYAPAADMGWSIRRSAHGEKLYAVATTSDLMYAAQFWLEYEGEQHDGAWVPLKVYGQEIFKGE